LTISLDPNYRAKLWSVEEASRWLTTALPFCDVLLTNEGDVEKFFQIRESSPEATASKLLGQFPVRVVTFTRRDDPLLWRNTCTAFAFTEGKLYHTRSYEVEIVDRLGTGDAFASGMIHGLLDDDIQKGLDYATAISALKHTIPGDFAWVTKDEVENVIKGGSLRIQR
jgi:2-dehydro-3-deoxygluconokinase